MKPILLAFSLIRVPKLFVTLLFWPLTTGVFIALTQVILSSAYLKLVDETPQDFEERLRSEDSSSLWLQSQIYNTKEPLPHVRLCRWKMEGGREVLVDPGCELQPIDIVLRVSSPETYDATEYVNFFNGSALRIHLCQNCNSDIVIHESETDGELSSELNSLSALGVFILTDTAKGKNIGQHYVSARQTLEHLRDLVGTIYFHPVGFKYPVNISNASKTMLLVINVSFLVLITLWLSLVGHRKVLRYFAENDALLPLVAACGKEQFYTSLWIITLLRVSFFLLASLPATYLFFSAALATKTIEVFVGERLDFFLWIAGIISSLGAISIIASIAELKHRHSMLSFLYKYAPMIFCIIGTAVWIITLFTPGHAAELTQKAVTALPLFGLSPMVLAPVFKLDSTIIALHIVLASMLVVMTLRFNSRWFATHLEEI